MDREDEPKRGDVKPLKDWSVADHLRYRTRQRSGQNPNPDLGRFPRVGDTDASPSDEELVAAGLRGPRRPDPEPYDGPVASVEEVIDNTLDAKRRDLRSVDNEIQYVMQTMKLGPREGDDATNSARLGRKLGALHQRKARLQGEIDEARQQEGADIGPWARATRGKQ